MSRIVSNCARDSPPNEMSPRASSLTYPSIVKYGGIGIGFCHVKAMTYVTIAGGFRLSFEAWLPVFASRQGSRPVWLGSCCRRTAQPPGSRCCPPIGKAWPQGHSGQNGLPRSRQHRPAGSRGRVDFRPEVSTSLPEKPSYPRSGAARRRRGRPS
jgi:hypothetical protein